MNKQTQTILIVAAVAVVGYMAYRHFNQQAPAPAPQNPNQANPGTPTTGIGGYVDTAKGVLDAIGDFAGGFETSGWTN